jgi:hypothetical protein
VIHVENLKSKISWHCPFYCFRNRSGEGPSVAGSRLSLKRRRAATPDRNRTLDHRPLSPLDTTELTPSAASQLHDEGQWEGGLAETWEEQQDLATALKRSLADVPLPQATAGKRQSSSSHHRRQGKITEVSLCTYYFTFGLRLLVNKIRIKAFW